MEKVALLIDLIIKGEMKKKGSVVEVDKKEAIELIARGVAREALELESKEFSNMTKKELLEVAKENGIEVDESLKKEELLELLEEVKKAQ